MSEPMLTRLRGDATQGAMRRMKLLLAAPVALSSAGCVQVAAPEKPIEINLNINIRQEVVVRLQQDVRDLIKENPGVF
jgi:YnbE-like lipoprotein